MAKKNSKKERKFFNFVKVTLRLNRGEFLYSSAGNPYFKGAGFLSMGKDDNDEYKPAKWFDLVLFAKEGEESNDQAIRMSELAEAKATVTVTARLSYEEWTRDDGSKGSKDTLVVLSFEEVVWDDEGGEDVPD
jgi:hypothetical protein